MNAVEEAQSRMNVLQKETLSIRNGIILTSLGTICLMNAVEEAQSRMNVLRIDESK